MDHKLVNFLDTSVILPAIIKWRVEEFNFKSKKYLDDANYRRVTSSRVHFEARSVLNTSRNSLTIFLQRAYENSGTLSPINFQTTIRRLIDRIVKENWERRILESYVKDKGDELFSIVSSDYPTVEVEIKRIQEAVELGLMQLELLCATNKLAKIPVFTKCPQDYGNDYPNELSTLMGRIGYLPDIKIILDSYFISKKIKETTGLVTLDVEHMISHKNFIDGILKSVIVFDFKEYS